MCANPCVFTGTIQKHLKLQNLYKKSLLILQKLPKDSVYRMNTETILCYRMSIVKEAGSDVQQIESRISCGNIDSLVLQAEGEYSLIQKMLLWKSWEPLNQRPPLEQWTWPPVIV